MTAILAARGVESGVPGLECETHGRATSENGLKGRIAVKGDQTYRNIANTACF
jgi:hypothetical protein